MKKQLLKYILLSMFAVLVTATTVVQAQTTPYRVSDRTVQYRLNVIGTKTNTFIDQLNKALDSSSYNNSNAEDNILDYVSDFEKANDQLKDNFKDKKSTGADVQNLLDRAFYINRFMERNRLAIGAENAWTSLRTELSTLSKYYNITADYRKEPISTSTAGTLPYRVSDDIVDTLLGRIEQRTDQYKRALDRALDRSSLNETQREEAILNYVKNFENSTDSLKRNFESKRSADTDVTTVLNQAYYIDKFMRENQLARGAERQWRDLRTDLETLQQYYNVNFSFNTAPVINNTGNSSGSYNVPQRDVKTLISSLENRTDTYKRAMNTALDRSVLNGTQSENAIQNYITEFENATDKLKQDFDANRSTRQQAQDVLDRAYYIDGFMRDYRLTANAEQQWRLVRSDLDNLNKYYGVNFDFNRQYTPATTFDSMLTGTYRLNLSQSDNVRDVVGRAINNSYPANNRDRLSQNLERRLTSPEMIVLEKRGSQVTVASSNSPQISFNADGVARNETLGNGRAIKVTAQTYYDGVALSYEGDRANDFYVNFTPINNRQLKIIRRVYLENRDETITVASIYDKTSETANFNGVNNNNNAGNNNQYTDFVVPNNTPLTATLNSRVSTKESQNGDRFTLEVTSPNQYRGAIIEGRIANADSSGVVSGRANLSMEFDTIRLRNGQTYRFAGFVQEVRNANGDKIDVNNEGTVRDSNQTTKTVTRAGIGAGIGAIIGAVIGGGSGAAIGAAIGGAGGAGTVLIQGRDNIDLEPGATFTLTATAPANVRDNKR